MEDHNEDCRCDDCYAEALDAGEVYEELPPEVEDGRPRDRVGPARYRAEAREDLRRNPRDPQIQ